MSDAAATARRSKIGGGEYRIGVAPGGQPAIYCKRGLICEFSAGSQSVRESDAAAVLAALTVRDLAAALGRNVGAAVERGSAGA